MDSCNCFGLSFLPVIFSKSCFKQNISSSHHYNVIKFKAVVQFVAWIKAQQFDINHTLMYTYLVSQRHSLPIKRIEMVKSLNFWFRSSPSKIFTFSACILDRNDSIITGFHVYATANPQFVNREEYAK